jgi:hypothetical protein
MKRIGPWEQKIEGAPSFFGKLLMNCEPADESRLNPRVILPYKTVKLQFDRQGVGQRATYRSQSLYGQALTASISTGIDTF